jgi:hypothetical protein
MISPKINKILKIILGIDFFLVLLSVFLMNAEILGFNFKLFHIIVGGILLLFGAVHIISHWIIK